MNSPARDKQKKTVSLSIRETVIFAMFGSLMFATKFMLEALPNIHPLALFITVITVVYRKKALIPLYIFVALNGVFTGFSFWWIPYLYIWLPLWGAVMLLPKDLSPQKALFLYPLICALHGILFGILYSPAQALMFDLTFEETCIWIAVGFPYDLIHAVGNFAMSLLAPPLIKLLRKMG